ncbi:SRPBCC domain-containing protein [Paenibacillus chondroitinus]|uniref:SRPBCC domain-containing protein n=1 Tax=Paenibacillus chondroitinus TaxID=59842 RepID=A0ABU6DN63_9BACL|nr:MULTISPECIES: SRPBCC domain-containing protein [Paenibacillus]MCY9660593.1 SRPBCC domain-containing protein [Paenibacillus anseongense]MEB4798227.1 SRPBCC domain-containing protein [Paenibacillus chondroitinus]
MNSENMVGLTAAAGFQIGVRRTLTLSQEKAWELLTSPQGRKLWLGETPTILFEKGHTFCTKEGINGVLRVVKPNEQLRLSWQPASWEEASTLQIRLLPAASPGRTTISFHQEKLDSMQHREEMKVRWEAVLNRLMELKIK